MKAVLSSMVIATIVWFGFMAGSIPPASAQATTTHKEIVIDVDSPLPASLTLNKGDTVRFVRSKSDREVRYIYVDYTTCCDDEQNVWLFNAGREQRGVPGQATAVRPGKGHITFSYQPPFFLESPEWKNVQVTVLGAPNEAVPEEWHDPNAWKAFLFLFLLPVIAVTCFVGCLEGRGAPPSAPENPTWREDPGDGELPPDLGDHGDASYRKYRGDRGNHFDG